MDPMTIRTKAAELRDYISMLTPYIIGGDTEGYLDGLTLVRQSAYEVIDAAWDEERRFKRYDDEDTNGGRDGQE
jgi:hypothetical protein